MDVIFFQDAAAFRAWLETHHDSETEIYVGFYKKSADKIAMTYHEAVDQALCFGWIDGVRRRMDDISYTNRFTPRTKSSTWSQVNIKKIAELTEQGLMHPVGIKTFEERDLRKTNQYSFEREDAHLTPEYEAQFNANGSAWTYFQAQSTYYQKAAIWWVISAKKEETRLRRLATLIEDSANEQRIKQLTYTPKSD